MRLLRCYGYCGKKYPKDELVKYGGKNHCKPCASRKEKEQQDRDLLYKTIQKVYNIPFPNGQMLRQIKMFKEERNYTYEGMTKTLCYFVKIQRKQPLLQAGLSFLPYYYDSAIKYYEDLEEKRKNTVVVENNIKIIKITPRKHNKREELIRKRIINLEGLLNDN